MEEKVAEDNHLEMKTNKKQPNRAKEELWLHTALALEPLLLVIVAWLKTLWQAG